MFDTDVLSWIFRMNEKDAVNFGEMMNLFLLVWVGVLAGVAGWLAIGGDDTFVERLTRHEPTIVWKQLSKTQLRKYIGRNGSAHTDDYNLVLVSVLGDVFSVDPRKYAPFENGAYSCMAGRDATVMLGKHLLAKTSLLDDDEDESSKQERELCWPDLESWYKQHHEIPASNQRIKVSSEWYIESGLLTREEYSEANQWWEMFSTKYLKVGELVLE